MGLFGVGEILYNLEERHGKVHVPAAIANIWPSRKDLRQASRAIGRGSVIGFFLGVLPGWWRRDGLPGGVRHGEARRQGPLPLRPRCHRGRRRTGVGQQRRATSSFIPLLTIGIPANASMAMLFAALLIVGVTPGSAAHRRATRPLLGRHQLDVHRQPDPAHLSIPLVGIFVKILRVRPAILAPITALITILGVYTINNSIFDIFVMIAFGILGYLMKKPGFEPGPLVLAFVLGSLLESSFRRSMLIFDGDPTGFAHPSDLRDDPGLPRACARAAAGQAGRSAAVPAQTPHLRATRRQGSRRAMTVLIGYVPTPVGDAALAAGLARRPRAATDVVILNSPRRGATVDANLLGDEAEAKLIAPRRQGRCHRPGRPRRPRLRHRRRVRVGRGATGARPSSSGCAGAARSASSSWAATPSGCCSSCVPVLAVKPAR